MRNVIFGNAEVGPDFSATLYGDPQLDPIVRRVHLSVANSKIGLNSGFFEMLIRCRHARYPPRSPSFDIEKTGAGLAFGSDWPCTWPPDPFRGIQQAMLREVRQLFTAPSAAPNPPTYAAPEERLAVQQGVDAYTKAGAYARFSERRIGTLEPGKYADLAVLSQDIFSMSAKDIGKTHVVLTMVGGKIVLNELQ